MEGGRVEKEARRRGKERRVGRERGYGEEKWKEEG